ncbi:MAG: hypothetical protein EP341_04185 [Sphingomonadales bacterium]|nr:MAG: hypothetical protein EP341_04185 [Sphingomonadales bacterium]
MRQWLQLVVAGLRGTALTRVSIRREASHRGGGKTGQPNILRYHQFAHLMLGPYQSIQLINSQYQDFAKIEQN